MSHTGWVYSISYYWLFKMFKFLYFNSIPDYLFILWIFFILWHLFPRNWESKVYTKIIKLLFYKRHLEFCCVPWKQIKRCTKKNKDSSYKLGQNRVKEQAINIIWLIKRVTIFLISVKTLWQKSGLTLCKKQIQLRKEKKSLLA